MPHAANNNAPITAAVFFAQLLPGSIVETETESATYNPLTQVFVPSKVKLVDGGLPPARAKGAGTFAISRGTVSFVGKDDIFRGSFE